MSTIAELSVLREKEDHIEFKRALHNFPFAGGEHKDPQERRKCVLGYIVAFANERGGRLVLGMEDHYPHAVSGTDFAQDELGALEDEIYKRLHIRVSTEELYDEANKRVLVITIPSRPIGKALRFEGVPLMRIGESLREMDDAEYLKIISESDPDYSAHICKGLTIENLNTAAIAEMRRLIAEKRQRPEVLSMPLNQLLRDLMLLNDDGLTIAALLLLGKKEDIRRNLPQCNVIVEYRANHSLIRYSAREEFCGPLFTIINEVWNYINQPACNPMQHIEKLPQIIDVPSFNHETVREALINSIIHRSLQMQGDTMVLLYPDSITISNPGGLPYGVNLGNILTVNSSPRSRLMAEAIEKTGLIERSGQGVDIMYENCISEGKRIPDYSRTDDFQVSLTLYADIVNPNLCLFINRYQNNASPEERLNAFDLLSLYYVKLRQTEKCMPESIERLKSFGLVVNDSYYRYALAPSYYGNIPAVMSGAISAEDLSLIVSAMRGEESVSMSAFVEIFDGIKTQKQTRTLIQKCCEDLRILVQEGNNKATKYKLSDALKKRL